MKMPNGEDNIPRQAVIVADSFNSRFKPITLEKPRCLLPLANKPLIDYTLQHLLDNGFHDLIILSLAHADKIDAHLTESRYEERDERVSIRNHILNSDSVFSLGDAMRDLADSGWIRGPFVFVTGDLVSNMDMRAAMEAHQSNKEKDSEALMTCIFKKVLPGHPTRGLEDDIVVCTNPSTNQLLRLQNANSKKFNYELDLFDKNEAVDFRYDLMNTYVIICEAHVLSRFGDHFDKQDMESFIKGIIDEDETCSETIYMHILEHSYAARVTNLRTYVSVSQDIIHRWTYPVVPDNNSPPADQYIYRRRGIYLPNSVRPYKAKIHQNTIVGSETTIDRNAEISDSVIGRKCEIGANVKITNSFIWDEVTIKNDCVIENSILCSGATVKNNTTVTSGCILSYDTVVGPQATLKPGTRLSVPLPVQHVRNDSECSTESEETHCTSDNDSLSDNMMDEMLGSDRWGKVYRSDEESDDSEEGEGDVSGFYRSWFCAAPTHHMDEMSDSSDSTPVPSEPELEEHSFYLELLESFRAGFASRTHIDHVMIEINSSKHAYNISVADTLMHATRALLEICPAIKEFPNLLQYFAPMFSKLASDRTSQFVMLEEIQTWALEQEALGDIQKILLVLYRQGILEEANILEWQETIEDNVKSKIAVFIKWLREAEEESSEEEESEEEEESD